MDLSTPAVVDTDVVSFPFKNHSLAPAYQAILAGRPLAVSPITLAEIEYGMEAKNWGASRRDPMRCFLACFAVLSPDTETARVWARIKSGCDKKGRSIAVPQLRDRLASILRPFERGRRTQLRIRPPARKTFIKIHRTLRTTPAMAAGVTNRVV